MAEQDVQTYETAVAAREAAHFEFDCALDDLIANESRRTPCPRCGKMEQQRTITVYLKPQIIEQMRNG